METKHDSSDFLLLFYNTDWHDKLSPEQIQQTMGRWTAWFDGLVAAGKCSTGRPLADEGRVITSQKGGVTDGPFAESKESICGYFFLHVADMDEAEAIARNCPALEHGLIAEVRPVLGGCQEVHEAAARKNAQLETVA